MTSRKFPNLTTGQRDELAVQFVACKGPIRHRWDLVPSSPDDRPQFGTLALFRCDNCSTYRRDIFSRVTGDLITRSYQHPLGYSDAGRTADGERRDATYWRALFAETVHDRQPDMLLDAEEPKPKRRSAAKRENVVPMRKRRRA